MRPCFLCGNGDHLWQECHFGSYAQIDKIVRVKPKLTLRQKWSRFKYNFNQGIQLWLLRAIVAVWFLWAYIGWLLEFPVKYVFPKAVPGMQKFFLRDEHSGGGLAMLAYDCGW